jgi:hypothetical protein
VKTEKEREKKQPEEEGKGNITRNGPEGEPLPSLATEESLRSSMSGTYLLGL